MKKVISKIVNLLFCVFFVATVFSCDSFVSGDSLTEKINQVIAENSAADVEITVLAGLNQGITIPNGSTNKKVGYPFKVSFSAADNYQFVKWEVINSKTGEAIGDAVSIVNATALETEVTINSKVENIKISPVCYERSGASLTSPVYSDVGEPRDSSIIITFTKDISEQNDFSKIKINCGGEDVTSSFKAPVLNGNILTIASDKTKLIDVESGKTKTVSITLPSEIYYTENGTNIPMNVVSTFSYKINNTTKTKAEITLSTTQEKGTVTPTGTKSYNIGETFFITFTPNADYNFTGWKILDGEGNEVDASVLKIEDARAVTTKVTVLGEVSGVSIRPVSELVPKVVSASPENVSSGVNFDSSIKVHFNKPIKYQNEFGNNVITVANNQASAMNANIVIVDNFGNYYDYLYTSPVYDKDKNVLTFLSDYSNYTDPVSGNVLSYLEKMEKVFGSAAHLDLTVTVQNISDIENEALKILPYVFSFRLKKQVEAEPPVVETIKVGRAESVVMSNNSNELFSNSSPFTASGEYYKEGQYDVTQNFYGELVTTTFDGYVPVWDSEQWKKNAVANKIWIYLDGYDVGGSAIRNAFVKETLVLDTDGKTVTSGIPIKTSFSNISDSIKAGNSQICFEYTLQSQKDGVVKLEIGFEDYDNNPGSKIFYVLKDTTAPVLNNFEFSGVLPDASSLKDSFAVTQYKESRIIQDSGCNKATKVADLTDKSYYGTDAFVPVMWDEDELKSGNLRMYIKAEVQETGLTLDLNNNDGGDAWKHYKIQEKQPSLKIYYTQNKSLINSNKIPYVVPEYTNGVNRIDGVCVILPKNDTNGNVIIDSKKNTYVRLTVEDYLGNSSSFYYDLPGNPELLNSYYTCGETSLTYWITDFSNRTITDYDQNKKYKNYSMFTRMTERDFITTPSEVYYHIYYTDGSMKYTSLNEEIRNFYSLAGWKVARDINGCTVSNSFGTTDVNDVKVFIQTVAKYGDDDGTYFYGPLTEVPIVIKEKTSVGFINPNAEITSIVTNEVNTHTVTVKVNNATDYDVVYAISDSGTKYLSSGNDTIEIVLNTENLLGDFGSRVITVYGTKDSKTGATAVIVDESQVIENCSPYMASTDIVYDEHGKYLKFYAPYHMDIDDSDDDEIELPITVYISKELYNSEPTASQKETMIKHVIDYKSDNAEYAKYRYGDYTSSYQLYDDRFRVPVAGLEEGIYYFYMEAKDKKGHKYWDNILNSYGRGDVLSLVRGINTDPVYSSNAVMHSHYGTKSYTISDDTFSADYLLHMARNPEIASAKVTIEYYDVENNSWMAAQQEGYSYLNDKYMSRDSNNWYLGTTLLGNQKFMRYFIKTASSGGKFDKIAGPFYFYYGRSEAVCSNLSREVEECIKDINVLNNGVQVYCKEPALIHTFTSDKNWGNDVNAWLYHCDDTEEKNVVITHWDSINNELNLSATGDYTQVPYYYAINKGQIESGKYYVVIATFADGTSLMSPVYHK